MTKQVLTILAIEAGGLLLVAIGLALGVLRLWGVLAACAALLFVLGWALFLIGLALEKRIGGGDAG